MADLGGSWVGDFRFAIWVLVCWSCVSVVVIWVGGFRFAHRLHVFCSSFARCWFVMGLLAMGLGFARRGSRFARRGYGFCLLWVWVLLGGDHGLLLFIYLFIFLGVEC